MHPMARTRASALIRAATGRRVIGTYSRYSNNDHWNSDLRTILLKMYTRCESLIFENHTAAILYIKKSKAEAIRDIHKAFNDGTWRWFGSLTAGVSACVSLSYILYERRSSMTEDHVNRRIDVQDKEIHLLRMEANRQVEAVTSNRADSLTTMSADEIGQNFFVIMNDSPCLVEEQLFEKDDKTRFICIDITTGKRIELIVPKSYMMKVPSVKSEECLVVYCDRDSHYITVLFEATKEQKKVRVLPGVMDKLSDSSKGSATVVTVLGRHIVTSVRQNEEESYWRLPSWIGRIFKGTSA